MNRFDRYFVIATLLLPIPAYAQHSLLHEAFSNPDFSTPANISTHVFNFFHHSCGANLLNKGLADSLEKRGYTLHSRILTTYEYENNYTDYRHWYKRFQRELGIPVGEHYYRYEGPDAEGNPITGDQIDDDYRDFMLNYYDFNAERMDIIMFKPCYPGSEIGSYDTQYDNSNTNNGYGNVTSGTPYSDNSIKNFTYLNSSSSVTNQYTNEFWSYGNWSSASSSLAQLKCAYRGMLNIFVEHPDILFIAMQAPPMVNISSENAANCREFARWMREDWLHQYDPTGADQFQDYPLKNVVPFDFHNSVAWTGNDPLLDNEYFWFIQNGFPDNTLDTSDPNKLGRNAGNNDHPETWLNNRTAAIFCGGTDRYSNAHTAQPARSYSCWINAVVNCWENQDAVPVELAQFVATYNETNNHVELSWNLGNAGFYYGFWVQRKSTQQPVWRNLGFVESGHCNSCLLSYTYKDADIDNGTYFYRLELIDINGMKDYSQEIRIDIGAPQHYLLHQNYPNPFNAGTAIPYWLNSYASIRLFIYDVTGRDVFSFTESNQCCGHHLCHWDGHNNEGQRVNSGIYFYRMLLDGKFSEVKKMVFVR